MAALSEIALSDDAAWKLSYLLSDSDDESDSSIVEEEKLEEFMQELYREITITSESCGVSVSDSSATVMAGIQFVPHTEEYFSDVNAGLPEMGKGSPENEFNDNNCTNNVGGGVKEMEGCDDGQWLTKVISWGPLESKEWTYK